MNSPIYHRAIVEPLESRQLFAADLSGLFGGNILFARKDGGVNRVHAAIHVDAESAGGALSGSIDIDGLGDFKFNGSANNSLIFLVFDGANGSGNFVASETSDGALSGELSGTIGGVSTTGAARLHDDGGIIASSTFTDQFAVTAAASATSGTFNTSAVAGDYGGSVIFEGMPPVTAATSSGAHRVHAVLDLATNINNPALLTGTFRMDHVGKYEITGSTVGDETVLVYNGGTGSGGIVLTPSGVLPGSSPLVPAGSSTSASDNGTVVSLTGKLFGTIDDMDVHARVAFHNSADLNSSTTGAPALNFGGLGAPVTPSILNSQATAAGTTTSNPVDLTAAPAAPSFINSGSTIATDLDNTMSSDLGGSIMPPSNFITTASNFITPPSNFITQPSDVSGGIDSFMG